MLLQASLQLSNPGRLVALVDAMTDEVAEVLGITSGGVSRTEADTAGGFDGKGRFNFPGIRVANVAGRWRLPRNHHR